MVGAGLLSFLMHLLKQPLLLGYLLGGVLVGPTGLQLVNTAEEIDTITELGLILLLFMIGLELDASELMTMFKTDSAVLVAGLLSFPVIASIQGGLFAAFAAGDSEFFGEGQFAVAYLGVCCAISSTMIVVKLLSEKMETDTAAGRLTVGVLMCEDLWAMVVLAIQPNLSDPDGGEIIKMFGLIALLIMVALAYAKFVLPAILASAAEVIELMLVLSLTWCFFICALAMLPFIRLHMETAAFIAGVSMATFPYSAEFNGKLKYIRDFFVTLYFCGLGMQIPAPTSDAIGKAILVSLVVLIVRWIGIFGIIFACGRGQRIAVLPTINLSQVSEFSLVICSLGKRFGHVYEDTFTILIWTFAFLAVAAQYFINFNHELHRKLMPILDALNLTHHSENVKGVSAHQDEDEEERDIVLLGFYKLASSLIAEFEDKKPELLRKIHVIDVNTALAPKLANKGVAFTYGDISDRKAVEKAHQGRASMVICSIPDSFLRGCTNLDLLQNAKLIWPESHVIVCADTHKMTSDLYNGGAAYVLNRVRLGAERLAALIFEHETVVGGGGEIRDIMNQHRVNDTQERRTSYIINY
jgi:Kef-type K+ transport system membrane component KefB